MPQFLCPMQRDNSLARAGRAPDARGVGVLTLYERLLIRMKEYLPIFKALQNGGVVFTGTLAGGPAVHVQPIVRVGKEPLPLCPQVHLVVVAHVDKHHDLGGLKVWFYRKDQAQFSRGANRAMVLLPVLAKTLVFQARVKRVVPKLSDSLVATPLVRG